MRTEAVETLVRRVAGIESDCTDRDVLTSGVEDLRQLKSWVDGREVAFARQIAKVSSFPEKSLAEAGRTSLRDGGKVLQRAGTAASAPEFGTSLDAGRLSGDHLDVLTRVLRELRPELRQELLDQSEQLVKIAEQSTPDEFARAARSEARRLERDGDDMERLERQRRAIRCNSWVDKDTRMGRWSVTFDPGHVGDVGESSGCAGRGDVPRRPPRRLSDGWVGEAVVPASSRPVGAARREGSADGSTRDHRCRGLHQSVAGWSAEPGLGCRRRSATGVLGGVAAAGERVLDHDT